MMLFGIIFNLKLHHPLFALANVPAIHRYTIMLHSSHSISRTLLRSNCFLFVAFQRVPSEFAGIPLRFPQACVPKEVLLVCALHVSPRWLWQ
jgi:hypothetical protein